VVADQWKNKNMKDMLLLYQKSSINLLLIGSFVFLCIWMNIDNLFKALRPEYAEGKWVVFILSMSVLFNMSMGINNIIIMITKYFRYDTYASITLGVMTIITNLIFIPIMGIEGAAMATLISVVAYHIYKVVLIQTKLKMQPFTIKTLLALISIVATYLILLFMPEVFDNYLLEVIFRCVIITALFGLFNRLFNISSDINEELNKYLVKARLRKPS
jgi:O-antigen/teichoic acid export membrane protein